MTQYHFACIPENQETRNPRLVATARLASRFAREPRVLTVSKALFDSADEAMIAEHRGVLGAWVTPVLFIPPRALCDTHADALAILECESAAL